MSVPENQSFEHSGHTCSNYDGWRYNAQEETAIGEALAACTRANDKRAEADRLKDNTLRKEADKDLAQAQTCQAVNELAYEARMAAPCSVCSTAANSVNRPQQPNPSRSGQQSAFYSNLGPGSGRGGTMQPQSSAPPGWPKQDSNSRFHRQ